MKIQVTPITVKRGRPKKESEPKWKEIYINEIEPTNILLGGKCRAPFVSSAFMLQNSAFDTIPSSLLTPVNLEVNDYKFTMVYEEEYSGVYLFTQPVDNVCKTVYLSGRLSDLTRSDVVFKGNI